MMSSEPILFPSASNQSKLSANPTSKMPQASDWIFQDFFNTMLNDGEYNLYPSMQVSDLASNIKDIQGQHGYTEYIQNQDSFKQAFNEVALSSNNELNSLLFMDDMPDLDTNKSNISSDNEEEATAQHCDNRNSMMDFSQMLNTAPVLIESTISLSSYQSDSDAAMSLCEEFSGNTNIASTSVSSDFAVDHSVKRRKSTSSLTSFKSSIQAFSGSSNSKKSKLNHKSNTDANPASNSPKFSLKSSISKRFHKYFKSRS